MPERLRWAVELVAHGYESDPASLGDAGPGLSSTSGTRGLRLGLIGTGLALKHLERGCSVAVVYPLQLVGETRDPATYWSRLGFHPFRDDVLMVDLALITLGEALRRLLRQTP